LRRLRAPCRLLTATLYARAPRQVIVAQKVTAGVYKGVTTSELDELAAETAASMTSHHPDYAVVRCSARRRTRTRRLLLASS
jgi:hypothetical protein